jgi:hypothetical protein
MKKTIILALALALVGGVAYANFCSRDIVPSASLLVPYIVVDTNADGTPDPNGYTTLTVVTNVSSAKQIIHVTVYNAVSQHVVDFDEVLSGYDVWSINWRDLVTGHFDLFDTGGSTPGTPNTGFWTGTTGSVGDTFGPTSNEFTSPLVPGTTGLANPRDIDYTVPAVCSGFYPWGDFSAYAGIIQSRLATPLVAWTDHDTNCDDDAEITFSGWLSTVTAHPLFFYATIDTVYACNGLFPEADSTYWTYDNGVSNVLGYNTEHNVLTGYDFYLNFNSNYSESLPAVGIEATDTLFGVGFYTHSKELAIGGATESAWYDDREPLGTAYAFNYFNSLGVTTEVGVWKNYQEFDAADEVVRACLPYIYYAWNEDELAKARTTVTCPSGLCFGNPEPNVFPFQTQKVPVTSTNFTGLMSGNGWMLIVFDPSIPWTDPYDDYLQAYVFAKYNYGGYTTAVEATTLANYWCSDQTLPNLNTFGFFGATP